MAAPPPRRTAPPPSSTPTSAAPEASGWKAKAKGWGMKALDKSIVVSDKIGYHANNLSSKFGGEAFWPVSGDFNTELEKCTRILRAFTVDGVAQKETKEEKKTGLKKQGKVFKKIPASLIRDAAGIVIYASQRMGTAPFGGSGGSGMILARLPDGSWSAPSPIAPGNFAAGLMFGLDIFEAVLIVRTKEALESFHSHQVTLGSEIAVAAGHYGAGAIAEAGKDRTAIFSFVRSRGFYAGAEAIAQAWFYRFDEAQRAYGCMGITQKDILTGHFRPTPEAAPLLQALRDAETGYAQRLHGAEFEYEQPFQSKDAGLPEDRESAVDAEEPPAPPSRGVAADEAPAPPPVEEKAAEETAEEKEKKQAEQAFYADMGAPPALPARR
ncbi:hypothetical protein JCM8097_002525 [Rhodosporidiobolus ruineniae]